MRPKPGLALPPGRPERAAGCAGLEGSGRAKAEQLWRHVCAGDTLRWLKYSREYSMSFETLGKLWGGWKRFSGLHIVPSSSLSLSLLFSNSSKDGFLRPLQSRPTSACLELCFVLEGTHN